MNIRNFKKYTALAFSPSIENFLTNCSHLVFRLSVSILMMVHGWSKLVRYEAISGSFPDPLGIGSQLSLTLTIATEFFASIFLAFGLFTRFASASLLVTMSIIVFIFHAEDPFNKKELALLYGFCFLVLMLSGSKKFSLDDFLNRRLK